MIVKEITFTDFNGTVRTETHYFNLSKTECIRLNEMTPGGIEKSLEEIKKSADHAKAIKFFEDMIELSYGVKSEDGRRMIKNKEVFTEFKESNAYDELFSSLILDKNALENITEFFKGIIPDVPEDIRAIAEASKN